MGGAKSSTFYFQVNKLITLVYLTSLLKDTAVYEPFFIDIINNEISEQHARILALMSKCYGGLFITGKIALKYIEFLKDKRFVEEF